MDIEEIQMKVNELEHKISKLPAGYISRKIVQGEEKYFQKWIEGGEIRSIRIKESDIEIMRKQISLRKSFQQELRELQSHSTISDLIKHGAAFETNVVIKEALTAMAESVSSYEKRECYLQLSRFLRAKSNDKVCIIYGLRRTGKTTMMRQAIGGMPSKETTRVAYIKAQMTDTVDMICRDLKRLYSQGYRYVFIDEITLLRDFIDCSGILSDVYAAQGMKLVLSGTDSLGFWLSANRELYDSTIFIRTSFIPFYEYNRVMKMENVEDYICYGGILRSGRLGNSSKNAADASFSNDESTQRYIDRAVCDNIQNSLACCADGDNLKYLCSLNEAGELTGAINRVIENMNYRFLFSVLINDLGILSGNFKEDKKFKQNILESILLILREMLQVRTKEDEVLGLDAEHTTQIKNYLEILDLVVDCPDVAMQEDLGSMDNTLFVQSGMRYSQVKEVVNVIINNEMFINLSELERENTVDFILEGVRVAMAKDMILLETQEAFGEWLKIFRPRFSDSVIDMLVYNPFEKNCRIYMISNGEKASTQQYQLLLDVNKKNKIESRFGKIVESSVIYNGNDFINNEGVNYRNIKKYLKSLPNEVTKLSKLYEQKKY